MSATSGIQPSQDLTTTFAKAVESNSTRFIKVSIQNESLVVDSSIPTSGSFQDDLACLQDDSVLPSDSPAYILAKLDDSQDWLAVFYVPDNAKIRDKMLYASTRASLMKTLGSALFTDSIFATSKSDLSVESYHAHRQHALAPKPLSSREQELSDLRQAESTTADYSGSRQRINHIGTGVGMPWSTEAESALTEIVAGPASLVVLSIDTQSETVSVKSKGQSSIAELADALPAHEPCFVFFAWDQADSKREIVFIYSCPSNSPIKSRMIYSSGSPAVHQKAKGILSALDPPVSLASRKIETSDPKELDEAFLIAELGATSSSSTAGKQSFARPKGPGRRR